MLLLDTNRHLKLMLLIVCRFIVFNYIILKTMEDCDYGYCESFWI